MLAITTRMPGPRDALDARRTLREQWNFAESRMARMHAARLANDDNYVTNVQTMEFAESVLQQGCHDVTRNPSIANKSQAFIQHCAVQYVHCT